MHSADYVIVTPARNESRNLGHTLAALVAQTHRPLRWVIVDDGSGDGTGELIDAAARAHPWIRAVHRADRGHRLQGTGIIEAFYDGYAEAAALDWRFVVKLDADLSFAPDYFARCLAEFLADPLLGIGGGVICRHDGPPVPESPGDPHFHVRGATKIYRRDCWEAIGGLVRAPGWDTIDELKANMLGWRTRTFRHIPLRHHRFTGTADGTWRTQVKFGRANYIAGYHPLFMAAKCLKRTLQPPYLLGALGLLWGYGSGYLRRVPPVGDPGLIRYVRRQQLNKLLLRPSLW